MKAHEGGNEKRSVEDWTAPLGTQFRKESKINVLDRFALFSGQQSRRDQPGQGSVDRKLDLFGYFKIKLFEPQVRQILT
jgi:hypothetical protein